MRGFVGMGLIITVFCKQTNKKIALVFFHTTFNSELELPHSGSNSTTIKTLI